MRMKLNFISPHPLPPRWAWWLAKLLPMSVHQSVNLMFLASSAAMAEKGMDATLTELVEDARGAKELIEWEKKPDLSFKRTEKHNNLNHCNAAGCDGVTCEGTEHRKGDF